MTDDHTGLGGQTTGGDDLVEIDLNFESMRRFQGEFSPNLSKGGLFIDTGEPLNPGSVVRFRVILPEEFVFLEGTAVVEWTRGAEGICDGAPGMALRFVTLSSQNQELVEQLVQDYIDTGGSPFDLDVRPVPGDFPTDALEGAPAPSTDSLDEGYRLTVRHTGPSLQADALRALAAAMPDDDGGGGERRAGIADQETPDGAGSEDHSPAESGEMAAAEFDAPAAVNEEADAVEEVHGFEIVSSDAAEVATVAGGETATEIEAIGEPPELDWSVEVGDSPDPAELPTDEETLVAAESEVDPRQELDEVRVAAQESLSFAAADPDDPPATDEIPVDEEAAAISQVLLPPSAFDDGPEVIEEVGDVEFGSPAFNVSLPENDDEPDTTPLLPDEGRDDVTVTPEDDFDEPPRQRGRWLLLLAAVVVLAVGLGLLWPHARAWLASRHGSASEEPVVAEAVLDVQEEQAPSAEEPQADSVEIPEPILQSSDAAEGEAAARDDDGGIGAEIEAPEPTAETLVERGDPEPDQAPVQLGSADAVTAIDVERGQSETVIRMRANGSLEDGVFSMETLSSPPRVLIRVRGITSSYRPYTIEAMTPEVAQIRSGLHEERRPPELWIVVDLAEPHVTVGGVSIEGDLARLVLARP